MQVSDNSIHIRLNGLIAVVLIFMTIFSFLIYETAEGIHLHKLNFLHIKFNHELAMELESFRTNKTPHISKIHSTILEIKKQPEACLEAVTGFEKWFMQIIGTVSALELCQKDINDADKVLGQIELYNQNKLSKEKLVKALSLASRSFQENSNNFEPLVNDTVSKLFLVIGITGLITLLITSFLFYLIVKGIKEETSLRIMLDNQVSNLAKYPEINPNPIITLNQNFEVEYSNPAFSRVFSKVDLSKPFIDQMSKKAKANIHKAFNEKKSIQFDHRIDKRWYTFYLYYIGDFEVPKIITFSHDITALKIANKELEEFSYRTSHDLRAPVVSVAAVLEIVDTNFRNMEIEKGLEGLRLAQNSVKKLEALVDDIISLARTKSLKEEKQNINLQIVIKDVLDRFEYLEGYEALSFNFSDIPKEDVFTYESRLKTVVENLISNAIKYADFTKDQPRLDIEGSLKDGILKLSFTDNGIGIPEANREQLFEMFQRFHSEVSFGSGLGMYMTKKSAIFMGGDIKYVPLKSGSKFILTVPVT